ncbi:Hint domain-containing protein [Haliangium sp.]|uniref:Hint domain-containing protein n=1 Tax=Haliangium sp. TaxID=2663208 RepID=UPI003D113349
MATDDVDQDQQQLRKQGYAMLSAAERQAYSTDRKYLQSLTEPNRPIRLNLADEHQYRFVRTRLRLAGKSPQNSPYLFDIIEKRRKDHLASGVTKGLLPGARYTLDDTGTRNNMHSMVGVTTTVDGNSDMGRGGAQASDILPDPDVPLPYVYTDVAYFDISGTPLSDLEYYEEFGVGPISGVTTDADLTLTTSATYVVDSYHGFEDADTNYTDSYTWTEVGTDVGTTRGGAEIELGPVANVLPKDKDGDGDIYICLSRTHADCDENLVGWHEVKLPLQGSLVVTNAHYIYPGDVTEIRDALAADPTSTRYGDLTLLLSQVGGGCDVIDGTTLQPSMKQFWDNVTVAADGKSMSWNLTGNNLAVFDDSCTQVNNDVILTLNVMVPTRDSAGIRYYTYAALTNNQQVNTGVLHTYLPMRMVNSCLAAGTMVELPSGELRPIESLSTGDRVLNRFHADAHALTVMDVAVGTEPVPMYRLEEEGGRTMLITEMHPVQTPDRGMVPVKYLREGDEVMMKDGPHKLVRVTREPYDGKVYNLKVGSESEVTALSEDQTTFYANGFLVGDLEVQGKYELADTTRDTSGDTLERLPTRWHKDYLNAKASKDSR